MVTFESKPEETNVFRKLVLKQAENSLEKESECHQFDVVQDESNENILYLYELYTNRKAFDDHLASDHFIEFNERVTPMMLRKEVLSGYQQINNQEKAL